MMSRIFFFILLFAGLRTVSFGQGQPLSTTDKRAEKLFYSAVDLYQERRYDEALERLGKAIGEDAFFTEAYILKGDILADMRDYPQAIGSYEAAIRTDRPFSPGLYVIIANLQLLTGRYIDARANYIRFLQYDRIPDNKRQQAEKQLRACDVALDFVSHPVPFKPVNLGDSINTRYDEYINAITPDEERLYFTRKNPRNEETLDHTQEFEEDFYVSRRLDKGWHNAVNLGPPVNTHGNEGALNISPDGKFLFFAACGREDGFGSCDIYWSRREGDGWSVPQNMGEAVNSPQWDSQPSFSSDGKTLYFVSKRPGGKGSSDIWKTVLQPGGEWSAPENLGDSVNTRAEEMAPFIHPDDRTLYFASKGHPGLGGFDLFLCRKDTSGRWHKPVNLGYPINTHADEMTLVINAKGDLAFISSDIPGGKGRQDICSFPLYPEARPTLTTYFKGIVYDAETKEKLEARFELVDLSTSKICAQAYSDRISGEFILVLPTEKNYALSVSRDGYLFYSDNFFLTGTGTEAKPVVRNVPLKPIRVGEAVVLKNIFFDTDLFTLKTQSVTELDKLVGLLQMNPKLKIELSGHTDNVGSAEHNLELSRNRAKAVYEYLVAHGIVATRLSYQGYGFAKPVDVNTTEEGRANNRRTEFRVVGN